MPILPQRRPILHDADRNDNVINFFDTHDPDILALVEACTLEHTPEVSPQHPLSAFSIVDFLADETAAPGFVVDGLFPRGDLTVLAARSGLGKSFLALQCAICVAAGRPVVGQAVQPGVAVGLFWEDPAPILRERLINLLSALDLTPQDVESRLILDASNPTDPGRHVLWRDGGPTPAFHTLDAELADVPDVALLVVDTAKLVFRDKIVDTEAVRYFVGELRALAARRNVAVVLITHVNRQGETSGTTEWENHARAVVHLKPQGDRVRLEVVKTNYAAPVPPLPLARTSHGAWTRADDAGLVAANPAARSTVMTVEGRARQAFLDGLDAATEPLSVNKHSPRGNYAPKRLALTRRAKQLQVRRPALEAAMTALLAEGVIVEVPGPGKHKTKILARAGGEVGPTTPN